MILRRRFLGASLAWWAALAFVVGYELVGRPGVVWRFPL